MPQHSWTFSMLSRTYFTVSKGCTMSQTYPPHLPKTNNSFPILRTESPEVVPISDRYKMAKTYPEDKELATTQITITICIYRMARTVIRTTDCALMEFFP